jgi:hypothetical protein
MDTPNIFAAADTETYGESEVSGCILAVYEGLVGLSRVNFSRILWGNFEKIWGGGKFTAGVNFSRLGLEW